MFKHLSSNAHGLVATAIGLSAFYLAHHNLTRRLKSAHKAELELKTYQEWKKGWNAGWDSGRNDLKPYLNRELYERMYGPFDPSL